MLFQSAARTSCFDCSSGSRFSQSIIANKNLLFNLILSKHLHTNQFVKVYWKRESLPKTQCERVKQNKKKIAKENNYLEYNWKNNFDYYYCLMIVHVKWILFLRFHDLTHAARHIPYANEMIIHLRPPKSHIPTINHFKCSKDAIGILKTTGKTGIFYYNAEWLVQHF